MSGVKRRRLLGWGAGLLAGLGAGRLGAATPGATEGPYYPAPGMRFPDIDNDLVKIAGLVREAGGEVITLTGRILDARGAARQGYRIEIWQCDVNGKYLHPGDRNAAPRDMAFQGFGHDVTDAAGRYRFRTIRPVPYPGRTPHIHVKIFDPAGREVLTTQFYLAGHPGNDRDRLFRSMSRSEAESVSFVINNGSASVDVTV